MPWFKDTFKQAPRELLWVALGALMLSAGASVIGYLKSIPAYLYIPLGVFTIAACFSIVNGIFQLRDRFAKKEEGDSSLGIAEEELERTIEDWLLSAGFKVERHTSDIDHFNLSAKRLGTTINVARLKDDPSRISIYEAYVLNDAQLSAINGLPEDIRSEVIEDMRIDIASFDIELGSQPLENPKRTIFYLAHPVDFEYLFDKEDFYMHISFVRRATTIVEEYLRRALRLADDHSTKS